MAHTFEHCLRGLFQQIDGGLTVEQVKGEVADRARIAERVAEKLGDLPHQDGGVSMAGEVCCCCSG